MNVSPIFFCSISSPYFLYYNQVRSLVEISLAAFLRGAFCTHTYLKLSPCLLQCRFLNFYIAKYTFPNLSFSIGRLEPLYAAAYSTLILDIAF